ncbi:MAG TPA: DUF362 domain-containing protein [Candidatus Hydrogenedentes bacterium]|nr:DUF362 domain-containing protein [Candidatus Hydrogenedentota bacterium]HNT88756.1 DUF362 domain-containing protein [Candidatus Hydrogenedentota bacterium]
MAKQKDIQHPEYQTAPMTRRRFVGRLLTAGGIGGAVTYLATAPEGWPLSMKDKSGLRSQPVLKPFTLQDYRVAKPSGAADIGIGRYGEPVEKLRRALDAIGGLTHYIQPGDIVLVKPNVAFDRAPNLGATSNPELVEELVRMLLVDCRAQEVRVADNPIESPADCFAKSRIREATEQAGGRVYLPDSNAFKMLHTPGADLIRNWWFFHRPFTNVDKVIGLAPVKDHNLCSASIGLKNWYGLLGGTRNQFHQDIHGIVSDLAIMIRPTLTILDGTRVLMKNGPTGGDPSNVKAGDAVLASLDPVGADAWAFEHLLERGRDYPEYLAKAEAKGAGKVDWSGRIKEITG